MRSTLVALTLSLAPLSVAQAHGNDHVGVGITVSTPGLSIGFGVPAYPQLVPMPGLPVYWDPTAQGNYFYSDGLYWVLAGDRWYSSGWYDGPWQAVAPQYVPDVILRVPVRYYRRPPAYFAGWRHDASPRWGDHWGREWSRHRDGWDRWDRRATVRHAPLPSWQRQYVGDRYSRQPEQQRAIREGHVRRDDRGGHGRGDDRGRGGDDRGRGGDDRGRGGDDRGRGGDDRGRGGDDRGRGGDDRGRGGGERGHGGNDRGRGGDDRGGGRHGGRR